MPQYFTLTADPADTAVVCWPEPSPLDNWWTEIMDGVTPHRNHGTAPSEDPHNTPSHRSWT